MLEHFPIHFGHVTARLYSSAKSFPFPPHLFGQVMATAGFFALKKANT
jgi:hypothetical protein